MAYNDSDLYHCDHCHALTQAFNFGAETHLAARARSAFALPSVTIAQALQLSLAEQLLGRPTKILTTFV